MLQILTNSLAKKFAVLALMLVCLVGVTVSSASGSGAEKRLPCCSECEADPTAPLCKFGCSPSC